MLQFVPNMSKEANIVLITVDSCRYDTAVKAYTPNLDSVGPLRRAETAGSFTYPAHHTYFIGNLPRLLEGDPDYIPGVDQIWRSSAARPTTKPIMESFNGPTIIDHYQRKGYNVQGFGGVTFFDSNNPNNTLPAFFDNFTYFANPQNLHPDQRIPRTEAVLPMGNIDTIARKVDGDSPFFLFVNAPETHIPYDVPGTTVDQKYKDLIARVYREQNTKARYNPDQLPFTPEEIELLKAQQVTALEWVDTKLGELFDKLPKKHPTLTIVCGDHGEEFGERGRFGHGHFDETVMTVPVWAGYKK